jgi:hypothetical protein
LEFALGSGGENWAMRTLRRAASGTVAALKVATVRERWTWAIRWMPKSAGGWPPTAPTTTRRPFGLRRVRRVGRAGAGHDVDDDVVGLVGVGRRGRGRVGGTEFAQAAAAFGGRGGDRAEARQEIARRADVGPATLYRRFPTKQAPQR